MLPFHFSKLEAGNAVETGIGSAQLRYIYIIGESERRGWQVLRHQIADHSPKGSHENKVLHSLQFFKRKEKIVLRFLRPSHVASNFNQKLVQVYMIRREARELLELTKKKTGGDRVHGYPKGIRIISLFSCCKDWAARLECLFR